MVIFCFPHYLCFYKLEFFYKENLFSFLYLVMYVYMYVFKCYLYQYGLMDSELFSLGFNNIIHFLT